MDAIFHHKQLRGFLLESATGRCFGRLVQRSGFHNPLLCVKQNAGCQDPNNFRILISVRKGHAVRWCSAVCRMSLLVDPSHLLSRIKVSQLLSAITASAAWRPERSAPLMDAVSM